MRGLILCLLVVVTVDAVRSQDGPPQSRYKNGKQQTSLNNNKDVGLPSGGDIPDNRGLSAERKVAGGKAAPKAGTRPAKKVPEKNNPPPCDQYCWYLGTNPVCGKDGKQYDNRCYPACRGVKLKCKMTCPCDDDFKKCYHCHKKGYSPVCVDDDENVHNECFAKCARKEIKCDHECPCR